MSEESPFIEYSLAGNVLQEVAKIELVLVVTSSDGESDLICRVLAVEPLCGDSSGGAAVNIVWLESVSNRLGAVGGDSFECDDLARLNDRHCAG